MMQPPRPYGAAPGVSPRAVALVVAAVVVGMLASGWAASAGGGGGGARMAALERAVGVLAARVAALEERVAEQRAAVGSTPRLPGGGVAGEGNARPPSPASREGYKEDPPGGAGGGGEATAGDGEGGTGRAGLPLCKTHASYARGRHRWVSAGDGVPQEELAAGRVTEWAPETCQLRRYDFAATARCLAAKYYLVFGDSIMRQAFNEFPGVNPLLTDTDPERELRFDVDEHSWFTALPDAFDAAHPVPEGGLVPPNTDGRPPRGLHWRISLSVGNYIEKSNRFKEERPTLLLNLADVARADVVIVNSGPWDMGKRFCGIKKWYHTLKSYLEEMKKHVKPGAIVALWGLHWLVWGPASHPKFRACNSPAKTAAFRDALFMLAGCLGLDVIDVAPITKAGPDFSLDGTHYNMSMHFVANDVVMNMFCREDPLQPRPPAACPAGHEERMLDAWDAEEDVRRGCSGQADRGGDACPDIPLDSQWGRVKAAAAYPQRAQDDAALVVNRGAPPCTSTADLVPGRVVVTDTHDVMWRPDGCELHGVSTAGLTACVARTKLVLLASNSYGTLFTHRLREVQGLRDTAPVRRRNPQSSFVARGSAEGRWTWLTVGGISGRHADTTLWADFLAEAKTSADGVTNAARIEEADVVLLEGGFDDMMWHYCGVEAFYDGAKRHLRDLKARAKHGARVFALPTQWLHFDTPERMAVLYRDPNYAKCHSPAKARVFREAYRLAAACAGVAVLDVSGISSAVPELTVGLRDGGSYRTPLDHIYMDVLAGVACGGLQPEQERVAPGACTPEAERTALTEWAEHPAVQRGCPDTRRGGAGEKCTREPTP